MKKKDNKEKHCKKFFKALALGILVLSGFPIAVSAIDDNNRLGDSSYGVFKDIKNNPIEFIKSEKLLLPNHFDYIEQMNQEFVQGFESSEKISYLPGDSLKEKSDK